MAASNAQSDPPTFAAALREALATAKISQKELSRRLANTTTSTPESEGKRSQILKWLRGKHEPERESAEAIEVALGITDGRLAAAIQRRPRGLPARLSREEELRALRGELAALREQVEALAADVAGLLRTLGSQRGSGPHAPSTHERPIG